MRKSVYFNALSVVGQNLRHQGGAISDTTTAATSKLRASSRAVSFLQLPLFGFSPEGFVIALHDVHGEQADAAVSSWPAAVTIAPPQLRALSPRNETMTLAHAASSSCAARPLLWKRGTLVSALAAAGRSRSASSGPISRSLPAPRPMPFEGCCLSNSRGGVLRMHHRSLATSTIGLYLGERGSHNSRSSPSFPASSLKVERSPLSQAVALLVSKVGEDGYEGPQRLG